MTLDQLSAAATKGDLLPCPFCGGTDDVVQGVVRADHVFQFVECTKCGIELVGHTEAEAIAAWNTRTHAAAQNVPVLLEAHFKRMQEACANYLEPTTYIARHPVGELCKWNTEFPEPDKHQSIDGALATTRRRDQAFISGMIYMMDGPEQRAAIAQATGGEP